MTAAARAWSRRRSWASCVAASAIAVTAACTTPSPPDDEPSVGAARAGAPRVIVLVTVDTLRADGVSLLGQSPVTSPSLAALAWDAVVFTRAFSTSSWTPPSMSSLFTSLHPSSHGVVRGTTADDGAAVVRQPVLSEDFTTLAEALHDAGYRTIGVPSNRHLMADLGFAQGFDQYYGEAEFLLAGDVNQQVRWELERAFGRSWRDDWKREPVFLWVHYFDPHAPYEPRRPWIDEYAPQFESQSADFPAGLTMREMRDRYPRPAASLARRIWPLYRSEISFWDRHFAQLVEELGLAADDVLLIFTADHGEEILEHGGIGHGRTLHREVVQVPLFVRWPAGLPPGPRLVAEPVSLIDVYPTVLALAGLEPPEGLQGRSLLGLLEGRLPDGPSEPLFFELHSPRPALASVLHGRYKLVQSLDGELERSLYDLAADPWERRDVSAAHPAIARHLVDKLQQWAEALPAPPAGLEERELDPEVERELRELGYIQ